MKNTIRYIINILIIFLIIILLYIVGSYFFQIYNTKKLSNNTTQVAQETFGDTTCTDGYIYEETTNQIDNNIKTNQLIGYIKINSVDLNAAISLGDVNDQQEYAMSHGVSLDPNSNIPATGGNTVLLGHRNYEFAKLEHVKVGDSIIVNIGGNTYLYEVYKAEVFDPANNDAVFYQSDDEELILYTCFPFIQFAPTDQRYGVYAKRVDKIPC